jgi:hypothetical protein
MDNPAEITLDHDGSILVLDRGSGFTDTVQLLRVDRITGDRTLVSDKTRGTGPLFFGPDDLTVSGDGSVLIAADETVFRVDPVTGNRAVLSGAAVGTGPTLTRDVNGIAISPGGTIVIASSFSEGGMGQLGLLSIDPATGNRTVISSSTVGGGPNFSDLHGLAFESGNSIVLGQNQTRSMFRVSTAGGGRALLSSGSNSSFGVHGLGPSFSFPKDVVVVPLPEPGTIVGAWIAVTIMLAMRPRRP